MMLVLANLCLPQVRTILLSTVRQMMPEGRADAKTEGPEVKTNR